MKLQQKILLILAGTLSLIFYFVTSYKGTNSDNINLFSDTVNADNIGTQGTVDPGCGQGGSEGCSQGCGGQGI